MQLCVFAIYHKLIAMPLQETAFLPPGSLANILVSVQITRLFRANTKAKFKVYREGQAGYENRTSDRGGLFRTPGAAVLSLLFQFVLTKGITLTVVCVFGVIVTRKSCDRRKEQKKCFQSNF